MTEWQRVLKVMLASPGDLVPERDQVARTLEELNLIWASKLRVRFDLLRSETHSRPGIGSDAQDVINRQIGLDYHIFLGMLWTRFGTETKRAGSGTEEEFRRAHALHEAGGDLSIMFYFKRRAGPSNSAQLARIDAFRNELEDLGVYYWWFDDTADLPPLLRLHFSNEMWARRTEGTLDELEEEPARWDYLALTIPDIIANFKRANREAVATTRDILEIAAVMEVFGTSLSNKNDYVKRTAPQYRGQAAVVFLNKVALAATEDFDEAAGAITEQLLPLRDHSRSAFEALTRAIAQTIAVLPEHVEKLAPIRESLSLFEERSTEAERSTGELRDGLLAFDPILPVLRGPIQRRFIDGRQRLRRVLQDLSREIGRLQRVARSAIDLMDRLR